MSSSPSFSVRGDTSELRSAGPVLYLFGSGLLWLLVGLVFSLVAAVKLQFPTLGAEFAFLSIGRVQGAANASLIYGFAGQAGMALTLWLLARLGERPLPAGGLAIIAVASWNVALTFGVPGILVGQGVAYRWLELPKEVVPLLFLSYITLAVIGTLLFFRRSQKRFSTAQAYLLVALFWFPWAFATGEVTLVYWPVRGVLQAIIAGWYGQAILLGWLTPIALGGLYSILPELSGRASRQPFYEAIGFWTWLILSGWTAGSSLVGGPVPAWIPTLAVASGVLLIIPTVHISLSLYTSPQLRVLLSSPGLFLATFSGISFTISGLATALTSFRCAREVLQHTEFFTGLQQLTFFGFIALALFAGIYVAVPRLLGRKLPFPILSFLHVAGSIFGVGIVVIPLLVGGWCQGWELNSQTPIVTVVQNLKPWLGLHAFGLLVFLGSQFALLANLLVAVGYFLIPFGKPVLDWVLAPNQTAAVHNK